MFDFKRAYHSSLAEHPDDAIADLHTPWGADLDCDQVLTQHPRPQMRRKDFTCLNGWWDYAIVAAADIETDALVDGAPSSETTMPDEFDGRILVPFSPEALLSGVKRQLQPGDLLWYRRAFEVPEMGEDERCLLHFEAVDYEMACFINGTTCGSHEGGYLPFTFDITEHLQTGTNTLTVLVADPSEHGMQPRGKQRLSRGSIWYTAQSGIWQTVWLEVVPAAHIECLNLRAEPDEGTLTISARVSAPGSKLCVELLDGGKIIASGQTGKTMKGASPCVMLAVPAPHLWSPDDPHLYGLSVVYGKDRVQSYCAFRTFSTESDEKGRLRFCCNHEPLFARGLLDQGYWSDGLLTAPSDEALIFDIQTAKDLGFNMLRKHIKVESDRWYYHCDRLGMVVWQDMVSGGGVCPELYMSQLPTLSPQIAHLVHDDRDYKRFGSDDETYRRRWIEHSLAIVEHLRNHPCIATWVIFNEGWGQFDAMEVTEKFRAADKTRLLDQASGWYDQGGGDFTSIHNYFRTLTVPGGLDRRAAVISEFGGLALHLPGHSAIERSYGYQTCTSEEDLTRQVSELIAQVDALESKGLSGYVYTQLSDVEEEVNGLIAYDRQVVKVGKLR